MRNRRMALRWANNRFVRVDGPACCKCWRLNDRIRSDCSVNRRKRDLYYDWVNKRKMEEAKVTEIFRDFEG